MTTWIALLRGINVGGAHRLAMADLRATVGGLGWSDVATYIQSGNVVFDADEDEATVAGRLCDALVVEHGLDVPVVVRSADEVAWAADSHPDAASGLDPKFLHVAFLDRRPPADRVAELAADAFAPDRWALDGRELSLTYPEGSARSTMTIDRFERPWGVTATARNLNTVRRLVALAGSR